MAKVKTQEKSIQVKDLSLGELNGMATQLGKDLQKKMLEKSVARLKNPREIFHMRKKIARLKTEINIKSRLNSVKSSA